MEKTKNWYAVYTKPKAEKQVYKQFTEFGYEAYLPLVTEYRQWSDRIKKTQLPLFRSYVFVKVEANQHHKIPKSVQGFVKFVNIAGEKIIVREAEIDKIKRFEKYGQKTEVSAEDFLLHDTVEFTRGELKGIQGKLAEIRGKYKFAVRIESLGMNLIIETSPDAFKKI